MAKLYFENRYEKRTFIGEIEDDEQHLNAIEAIYKDIEARAQPSFKCYYIRWWQNNEGETVFDISSHVEFYILVP